jgi:5'-3' exonuclease
MGVERFFSSLKTEFNVVKNLKYPFEKIDSKYFFIDFNSIIHVISAQYLSDINKKKEKINLDTFNNNVIDLIKIYIINLLKNNIYSKNLHYLGLFIDGIPSMAKMHEQKKRRYVSDFINELLKQEKLHYNWDKNNISPATNFMKLLELQLDSKEFNLLINKTCPNMKKYFVSNTNEAGEGEMKIINYIRKNLKDTTDDILVYSPDSDMIILLMLLKQNTLLLRYDQQKSKDSDKQMILNFIEINNFKNVLVNYCYHKLDKTSINRNNLLNDIIFITTVFGDDFLPKLETFRISNDIFFIIDKYLINLLTHGHLLIYENKYIINTKAFYNFLVILEKSESYFLHRNYFLSVYNNFYNYNDSQFHLNLKKLSINIGILTNLMKNDFFYYTLLRYIDDEKLYDFMKDNKSNDKIFLFKKLYYYEVDRDFLADNIISYYKKFNSLPVNIKSSLLIDNLRKMTFSSETYPHSAKIQSLNPRDTLSYKINYKLDRFYKLLNPIDKFYSKYFSDKSRVKRNEHHLYYKQFKFNDKDLVKKYLKGWNWVVNYYFNNHTEKTWYYYDSRSPLLLEIVNHYNEQILLEFVKDDFSITRLEQFIFITPFNLNYDLNYQLQYFNNILSKEDFNKVIKFITENKKYFNNLGNFYKNLEKYSNKIDCSTSLFVNKCSLDFLDYYVDIKQFCKDLRKYINYNQQVTYYPI